MPQRIWICYTVGVGDWSPLTTRSGRAWHSPHSAAVPFGGQPVRDKAEGHAPLALWVIGNASLDEVSERAAAIVGTQASTAYGEHVAGDLAAGLAEHEVAVVSGGAIVL